MKEIQFLLMQQWSSQLRLHPQEPLTTNWDQIPNRDRHKRLQPCTHSDEWEHNRMFCHDVRADQMQGIVYLNACGRLSLWPREGNRGQTSGYRLERWILSMREYPRQDTWQGQQARRAATMTSTQPPWWQHDARCQLDQRAMMEVTVFCSWITWQMMFIDGYYSVRFADKQETEEGCIND